MSAMPRLLSREVLEETARSAASGCAITYRLARSVRPGAEVAVRTARAITPFRLAPRFALYPMEVPAVEHIGVNATAEVSGSGSWSQGSSGPIQGWLGLFGLWRVSSLVRAALCSAARVWSRFVAASEGGGRNASATHGSCPGRASIACGNLMEIARGEAFTGVGRGHDWSGGGWVLTRGCVTGGTKTGKSGEAWRLARCRN